MSIPSQPGPIFGPIAEWPTPPERSHMAEWLIGVGMVTAVAGLLMMWRASVRKDREQDVSDLTVAMGGYDLNSHAVQAAVTLGHWGLGILIVGGVLALGGLLVVAARRS